MRKRISRDKDIKGLIQKKPMPSTFKPVNRSLQMVSMRLLATKTEGVQTAMKFQKQQIGAIVRGGNILSVQYQQIQKNVCFQQYIHRYYQIKDTRHIFSDLIHSNTSKVFTFVDFKQKNFKIMSGYANLLKIASYATGKQQRTLTTFHSSDKENLRFKEMQIKVKKMTKHRQRSPKKIVNHKAQASLIQIIASIQKMYKHNKYSSETSQCRWKAINNFQKAQKFTTPDVSQICPSRIHTSPETMACDSYGLTHFSSKNRLKAEKSAKTNKQQHRLAEQPIKQTVRYHTQYDNQYVQEKNTKVSKRIQTKKSLSKNKSMSKIKSPPIGVSLKAKK